MPRRRNRAGRLHPLQLSGPSSCTSLVVGGAGYIGEPYRRATFRLAGHEVRVLDNLSLGHREAVDGVALTVADLADRPALDAAFRGQRFEAVIHFAALASVPESVSEPARYYRNNLVGTLNLLDAMREAGVARLVFSSTCAVYGPAEPPITEESPLQPINPYGFTKLYAASGTWPTTPATAGLGFALRYFNACDASDPMPRSARTIPRDLIPIALQVALGQRDVVTICGTDYLTPDGTCIRDFIHVDDLADAHERVLHRLEPGRALVYNVGTGRGSSVLQVIEAARRVTGRPIPSVNAPPFAW